MSCLLRVCRRYGLLCLRCLLDYKKKLSNGASGSTCLRYLSIYNVCRVNVLVNNHLLFGHQATLYRGNHNSGPFVDDCSEHNDFVDLEALKFDFDLD